MKLPGTRKKSKYELRCICTHEPLLAVYGVDERGQLYIHVKVYKGNRLYSELVIVGDGARVSVHCRNCARWHKITIRQPHEAVLTEDRRPTFLGD